MKQILPLLFIIVNILVLQRCSEVTTTGNGGSSETVNAKVVQNDTTITVSIDRGDQTGIQLYISTPDYQPYEQTGFHRSRTAPGNTTSITVPAKGFYNLFIRTSDSMSCFVTGIAVAQEDTLTTDYTLSKSGNVSGVLEPSQGKHLDDAYILSIVGSPFYATSDASHAFTLAQLPVGTYTLSVRPNIKRLFLVSAKYSFSANDEGGSTNLHILLP